LLLLLLLNASCCHCCCCCSCPAEFHVIQGVLDLGKKKGFRAMTALDKVFMLSTDDVIDRSGRAGTPSPRDASTQLVPS
jgi:hypothetical protein